MQYCVLFYTCLYWRADPVPYCIENTVQCDRIIEMEGCNGFFFKISPSPTWLSTHRCSCMWYTVTVQSSSISEQWQNKITCGNNAHRYRGLHPRGAGEDLQHQGLVRRGAPGPKPDAPQKVNLSRRFGQFSYNKSRNYLIRFVLSKPDLV